MSDEDTALVIDDHCFVCGKKNASGLKLEIKPCSSPSGRSSKGAASVFTLSKIYQGYGGIVHGGILSTILDEVMIYALIYNDIPAMTAKMEIKFKAQASPDEILRAEAWIARDRGKMAEAEGRLMNARGGVIAEAKGLFVKAKKLVKT